MQDGMVRLPASSRPLAVLRGVQIPSTSCGICPGAHCIHRAFSCSPRVPYSLLYKNGISAPWNKEESSGISSKYLHIFKGKQIAQL